MRWNRGIATRLLVCLVVFGTGVLFVLPVLLTTTTALDSGAGVPPAIPPDPVADAAEVQELLETTYLGHAGALPDPGEPAVVLRKYLEQNAHGYHSLLAKQETKLDLELTAWKGLVQSYPQSRHVLAALAEHYRTKAQVSGGVSYLRQAADAYVHAADIGLANGHIRYTRKLSDLLVQLGDKTTLDDIFGRLLAQPQETDRDNYYLALVDYADGLARFSDERAWGYFEQALDLHSENNLEAINRYTRYLIDRGQAQKAVEVLDTRLTPEQRVRFHRFAFLKREALEQAGLDTSSVDTEVGVVKQRLGQGPLLGSDFVDGASLGTASKSPNTSTETSTAMFTAPRSSALSTLFAPSTALAQIPPNPVSTVFTANTNNTIWKGQLYIDSTMSSIVQFDAGPAKKLTTLRWPDSRAGLVRIGTDNTVSYRYFNGTSWQAWQSLGGSAVDITAIIYNNGQADIFRTDGCNIYNSHSVNGQTFGGWTWWGACGDEIAAAIMPNGKGWFALRATGAGN